MKPSGCYLATGPTRYTHATLAATAGRVSRLPLPCLAFATCAHPRERVWQYGMAQDAKSEPKAAWHRLVGGQPRAHDVWAPTWCAARGRPMTHRDAAYSKFGPFRLRS